MADISLYAEDIVMCTVCCSKCSRHGATFSRRVSTVKQTPPVYDTKLQLWQFNLLVDMGILLRVQGSYLTYITLGEE